MTQTTLPRFLAAALLAACLGSTIAQTVQDNGVVRVKSAYNVDDTIARLKADIATKGIRFFAEIDQSQLAQGAGIKLHRSTLLEFGNPPLGTQFITARAEAGLDWPVRLLVTEDERGDVWAVYTDFNWIAQRHGITNRVEQFKTGSGVVASITSESLEC